MWNQKHFTNKQKGKNPLNRNGCRISRDDGISNDFKVTTAGYKLQNVMENMNIMRTEMGD